MKHVSPLFPLLLLAGACTAPARAQTTGSFDTAVAFAGGSRAVSLYVPTAYTPATKYRLMVGLHGLGDSCAMYRNGLIGSLGWAAAFPNTIIVCPESETRNDDFYTTPGSEAIIQQSIALAMARYHIDTANVVLQGFSLGGRAALRYGLDHPATFKGLLLNTPALQGVKNAVNGQSYYSFNYANAGQLPIYITHGATDIGYTSPIDSAYELLVRANARVRYYDLPGLGHAIPPYAQMADALPFFNAPARAGIDAEAVLFTPAPLLVCTAPASARLLFRNTAQVPLTSVSFRYTLGSQTGKANWTGTLQPFQSATLTIPFTAGLVAGDNAVSIRVDSLNGTAADSVASNNEQAATLHYAPAPLQALNEGFESSSFPPAGWVADLSGDFYTGWDSDNVAKSGTQSASAFNTVLYFDNSAREDGLISPVVTLPMSSPRLYFDVAYNYHRYTPPYLATTTDFADTLEVSVTTDCGAHYTRLYQKGGAALATFATPITNALSLQTAYTLQPADSNWRTETLDLSSLVSGALPPTARFRFSYRSALGGSIRIDNVRTGSATGIESAPPPVRYTVYPNPAGETLFIAGAPGTTATLSNTLGQEVRRQRLTGDEERMDLTGLAPGLYLLQLTGGTGTPFTTRISRQ